jgi:AraC-like DNA-binding protein
MLRLFAEGLERLGGDMAPVLAAAGIDPDVLTDREARIPNPSYRLVWSSAARVTGDPCIGLHVGEVVHPRAVNLFGYLLLSSETLGAGIERVARYQRILVGQPFVSIRRTEHEVRLGVGPPFRDPEARAVHAEYGATSALQLLGWVSETEVRPLKVHIAHAPRGPRREYVRALHAPVRFDAERTELLLDPVLLERPSRSANAQVAGMLDEQGTRLLESLRDTTLPGRVRRSLAAELDGSPPTIEQVARSLAMSVRSLQRGLSAERTSFRVILDELRREIARDYLQSSEAPINEIAYLAVFSEVSAFSRAVSRWFGHSPVRVRERGRRRVA